MIKVFLLLVHDDGPRRPKHVAVKGVMFGGLHIPPVERPNGVSELKVFL